MRLVLVLMACLFIWDCEGVRRRGSRNKGIPDSVRQAYEEALSGGNAEQTTTTAAPTTEDPYGRYIPPLPRPEEVECHIEVTRVERQGGKCTRLGGVTDQRYICQSGKHFEFSPECERLRNGRRNRRNNLN